MAAEAHKQQKKPEPPQQISLSKAILRIQNALLDLSHCANHQLLAAGSLLSRPDYDDVVTERCIAGLCGYPLCPNRLPTDRPRRGRYRISLSEHRVYDLQESYSFCSEGCLIGSRAFAGTLEAERCSDLTRARISQVLALFDEEEGNPESVSQVLAVKEKKKRGSLDDVDLGLSKLTIWEKNEVSAGDMPLQDWAGPANAIEGYVPQRDRENGSIHKPKSKSRTSQFSTMGNMDIMDFTSEILCGDNLLSFQAKDLSSSSYTKSINKSTTNTNGDLTTKVNLVSTTGIVAKDPSHASADQQKPSSSLPDFTDSQWRNSEGGESQDSHGHVKGEKLKSSLKFAGRKSQNHTVKWADKNEENGSLIKDAEGQGHNGQAKGEMLKSSFKLSGKKTQNRTVKWADKDEGNNSLNKYGDSEVKPCLQKEMEIDQVQSSEGGSGQVPVLVSKVVESNVADAVSGEGTSLPTPMIEEALDSYSDAYQEDPTYQTNFLKWPKKSGFLDSDMFDATDSWHDAPPEGFSLTLSTFATMWMALFGWVSSSSIAYIYGRSEESREEFSFVNGREYPRKISLSDGRSTEIKQTLAGCVARSLPQVVLDLRLPTSISVIEKAMGQLLETMSFMEAIPPFKTKEWHAIVLLLIDALSVFQIPALTRHMVDNRALLQKVLDAAQIGKDEYETMKDLLLPLGRSPPFPGKSGA